MSKLQELIDSKIELPKKSLRATECWGWTGKVNADYDAILKVNTKSGSKTIDVARFKVEESLGSPLKDGEELRRIETCEGSGCANPKHRVVTTVSGLRFSGEEERISAFKRAVAAGARVRPTAKEHGISPSWAYQIANGERYAEVEPKGSVINRIKHTLTPEQVAKAKRLRAKRWTYTRIATKLDCHYSTAREACLIERESWK